MASFANRHLRISGPAAAAERNAPYLPPRMSRNTWQTDAGFRAHPRPREPACLARTQNALPNPGGRRRRSWATIRRSIAQRPSAVIGPGPYWLDGMSHCRMPERADQMVRPAKPRERSLMNSSHPQQPTCASAQLHSTKWLGATALIPINPRPRVEICDKSKRPFRIAG